MTMPEGLSSLDWEARDFLGWRDPRAPQRAYLVQWRDGNTVGTYICADLACPVNVRSGGAPSAFTAPSGRPRPVEPGPEAEEAVRRRVAGLGERLAAFTDSVLQG